jgi:ribosomal protein S18 acetylase RimI-like enzyme
MIVIRPAVADDLRAVRLLLVATWHDTYDHLFGSEKVTAITDAWHSESALARGLDRRGHLFLVAEKDGAIVGTISATDRGGGLLWVDRLYVSPALQRCGLGRALLDTALTRAPQASEVRLEVERGNAGGLAFYAYCGFSPAGDETTCGGVGQAIVLKCAVSSFGPRV